MKIPTEEQIRKTLKDLHGLRIEEQLVFEELDSVEVTIKTKSGRPLTLTINGSEMLEKFWMMQTVSNCVGFPVASEIDVAVVLSVIANPIGPLEEWFAGNEKLINFFKSNSKYKAVYWEMKDNEEVLRVPITWEKNMFFSGSKKKIDLEIAIINWLCKAEKTKIVKSD